MSHETARRARVALGRTILEHRERRQITREQLGTLTDLSRFTVEQLELGRQQALDLDHGRKLAAGLGIPIAALLPVLPAWRDKLLAEAQMLEEAARRLRELACHPDLS